VLLLLFVLFDSKRFTVNCTSVLLIALKKKQRLLFWWDILSLAYYIKSPVALGERNF